VCDNRLVRQDTPIHTFWAIIIMTIAALVVTHLLEVPGDSAIWWFVGFMLVGLPLGEIAERMFKKNADRKS
jgi:hypothetical protein